MTGKWNDYKGFVVKIPKKYHDRVSAIDESGNVFYHSEPEVVRYFVYLKKPYVWDDMTTIGCYSKKEVLDVVRGAEKIDEKEWEEAYGDGCHDNY